MIICKDCGKAMAPEECKNLKVNDPKETFGFRLDQLCDDCFNKRLKDKADEPIPIKSGRYPWGMDHDPLDKSFGKNDIFRIIDDAMEKRDRCVRIFITSDTLSIDISPYDTCGWDEAEESDGDTER